MNDTPSALGLDAAIVHLYGATLTLMERYTLPFVPLEVVRETLGWDAAAMAAVVDAAVDGAPVVLGGLVGEWMDDGDRPSFGRHGVRFLGIRPAPQPTPPPQQGPDPPRRE